jgi:Plasmid pRiA4b ORF-3-like protein
MARKKAGPALTDTIYQLKVTLRVIRPPIWRRLEVPDCTLAQLHNSIQAAMGWYNCHLHAFRIGTREFSIPPPRGMDLDLEMEDSSRISLGQIAAAGIKKFQYEYDFGDGWGHDILIEKGVERQEGVRYPRCAAGKRACPPEDCGGPWGYADFLEAISNPKHESHEELLEWVGGEFDPEAFDLEAVNRRMRSW